MRKRVERGSYACETTPGAGHTQVSLGGRVHKQLIAILLAVSLASVCSHAAAESGKTRIFSSAAESEHFPAPRRSYGGRDVVVELSRDGSAAAIVSTHRPSRSVEYSELRVAFQGMLTTLISRDGFQASGYQHPAALVRSARISRGGRTVVAVVDSAAWRVNPLCRPDRLTESPRRSVAYGGSANIVVFTLDQKAAPIDGELLRIESLIPLSEERPLFELFEGEDLRLSEDGSALYIVGRYQRGDIAPDDSIENLEISRMLIRYDLSLRQGRIVNAEIGEGEGTQGDTRFERVYIDALSANDQFMLGSMFRRNGRASDTQILFRVALTTGEMQMLEQTTIRGGGSASLRGLWISDDGQRLRYHRVHDGGEPPLAELVELSLMEGDAANRAHASSLRQRTLRCKKKLPAGGAMYMASLSQDGNRAAFAVQLRKRAAAAALFRVGIMNLNTGRCRYVEPTTARASNYLPTISADGGKIAYLETVSRGDSGSPKRSTIFAVDADRILQGR